MIPGPAWNGFHPYDAEAERVLKNWALGPRPKPLPGGAERGAGQLMVAFTTKQKEALDHPVRKAIYDYLLGEEEPQTVGMIVEAVEFDDFAIVFHHLQRLGKVQLVEKVWATNLYRVVER